MEDCYCFFYEEHTKERDLLSPKADFITVVCHLSSRTRTWAALHFLEGKCHLSEKAAVPVHILISNFHLDFHSLMKGLNSWKRVGSFLANETSGVGKWI